MSILKLVFTLQCVTRHIGKVSAEFSSTIFVINSEKNQTCIELTLNDVDTTLA